MQAIDDVRSLTVNPIGGRLSSVFPVACLAVGGPLSLAWFCALALFTYNIICWLFDLGANG
jgi:hypothetical protein